MEAEVITKFLADLVNATSDCVQSVSDQCLAKGLLTRPTYDRVLESGGTSVDKARILILAVQNSTKTDSVCFNLLLKILDEMLPPSSKQKLLSEMRKELADRVSSCKALVPVHPQQCTESDITSAVASLQCIQQQSSFLCRYENSVSRLAYSSAQKNQFEEELQNRLEECEKLKCKLELLESQFEAKLNYDEKEVLSVKNRISTSEKEMDKLKQKIEEVQCIIEEESMHTRRFRNTIGLETQKLFDQVIEQSQIEIRQKGEEFMELLKNKEEDLKVLTEREAATQRSMQEANAKVRELEHELALQKKELQIKEMELNSAHAEVERQKQSYQRLEGASTQEPEIDDRLVFLSTGSHSQSSNSMQLELNSARAKMERKQSNYQLYEGGPTEEADSSIIFSRTDSCSRSSMLALQDLVKELYRVADKWEDIGIILDIESVLLRRIKSNNDGANAACLREMLNVKLNRSPSLSWLDIADTVEVVGNDGLANHLRAKYCYRTRLTQHRHGDLLKRLSECAFQWKEIGAYLKFTESELNKIEKSTYMFKRRSCSDLLNIMLSQWLQWAPGDARGSTNYPTLEALDEALRKTGCKEAAQYLNAPRVTLLDGGFEEFDIY